MKTEMVSEVAGAEEKCEIYGNKEICETEITRRQMIRALFSEIVPSACLFLPYLLCRNGSSPILSGLVFVLSGIAFTIYLTEESQYREIAFWDKVYGVRFLIRGFVLFLLFVYLLKKSLFEEVSVFYLGVPFAVTTGFAVIMEQKHRMRFYEVLFYRLLLPLLFIFLLLAGKIIKYRMGIFMYAEEFTENILHGMLEVQNGYTCLWLLLPLEFLFFTMPYARDPQLSRGSVNKSMVWYGAFSILFGVGVILLCGRSLCGRSVLTIYDHMKLLSLSGDILNRLYILFFGIFIFGFYGIISSYFFYAGKIFSGIKSVCEKQTDTMERRKLWIGLGLFLGMLLCLFLIEEIETLFEWYLRFTVWIDLPLAVILPLFMKRRKEKERRDICDA